MRELAAQLDAAGCAGPPGLGLGVSVIDQVAEGGQVLGDAVVHLACEPLSFLGGGGLADRGEHQSRVELERCGPEVLTTVSRPSSISMWSGSMPGASRRGQHGDHAGVGLHRDRHGAVPWRARPAGVEGPSHELVPLGTGLGGALAVENGDLAVGGAGVDQDAAERDLLTGDRDDVVPNADRIQALDEIIGELEQLGDQRPRIAVGGPRRVLRARACATVAAPIRPNPRPSDQPGEQRGQASSVEHDVGVGDDGRGEDRPPRRPATSKAPRGPAVDPAMKSGMTRAGSSRRTRLRLRVDQERHQAGLDDQRWHDLEPGDAAGERRSHPDGGEQDGVQDDRPALGEGDRRGEHEQGEDPCAAAWTAA